MRDTATSPWASNAEGRPAHDQAPHSPPAAAAPACALHWVVLGVSGSKRSRGLRVACAQWGQAAPRIVEWAEWLARPSLLDEALASPCVFKIEPPGDDPRAHHRLMQQGAALLGEPEPAPLLHGEVAGARAWFEGFRAAMRSLAEQLAQHPHAAAVNTPADIVAMTDKLACQHRLQAAGLHTPRLLGPITGHDALLHLMDEQALDRVFVKAQYGSSASGVVAFRRNRRGQQQATTTAHLVHDGGTARLFNVKRVRRYEQADEIRQVVDRLAAEGAYAEAWVTKPRCGEGHFDLRVLALGGRPAHRVARVSAHTMTNLHLDAHRADPAALLSDAEMRAAEQAVARAAAAFPGSRVIGFDIVPHATAPWVLEANAFGDLLPGLLWQGLDAHAALLETGALP